MRKQDGFVSTKEKLTVEEHYDDLGDSLNGLGSEITTLMQDVEKCPPLDQSWEETISV